MIFVKFYEKDTIKEGYLRFAVIVSKYRDKWVVVKNKKRTTWEIPGGTIEVGEKVQETAKRELFEETGAKNFTLIPVCIYSVIRDNEEESFGGLYYSEIKEMGELPNFEIEEIKFVDELPDNLTYPDIQPHLFKRVIENIEWKGFWR